MGRQPERGQLPGRGAAGAPDAVGRQPVSHAGADRTYGPGGQLCTAGGTRYGYNAEGNLTRKTTADGQQ